MKQPAFVSISSKLHNNNKFISSEYFLVVHACFIKLFYIDLCIEMERSKVTQAPPTAYYIPNFITEQEEKDLLAKVYSVPLPKWTQLSNRRLQNWGGIPHNKGMIAEEIPQWLLKYLNKIDNLNLMDGKCPNHVLINEYLVGQGIMPHFDGSLYYPTITTISLNSPTVLKFVEPKYEEKVEYEPVCSLLIEPRSLLVLQDNLFSKYLHTIEETTEDLIDTGIVNLPLCDSSYTINSLVRRKRPRISLTIRHVPKTSKIKLNF